MRRREADGSILDLRVSYLGSTAWGLVIGVAEVAISGTVWAAMAGAGVTILLGVQIDRIGTKAGQHNAEHQEEVSRGEYG